MPSVERLQTLGELFGFEVTDLFVEEKKQESKQASAPRKIAVAGVAYVGLSPTSLPAKNNHVLCTYRIPVTCL